MPSSYTAYQFSIILPSTYPYMFLKYLFEDWLQVPNSGFSNIKSFYLNSNRKTSKKLSKKVKI